MSTIPNYGSIEEEVEMEQPRPQTAPIRQQDAPLPAEKVPCLCLPLCCLVEICACVLEVFLPLWRR